MKRKKPPSDGTKLVVRERGQLERPASGIEQNPCVQYLMKLRSDASRRTVRGALDRAAKIFDAIDRDVPPSRSRADAASYPWTTPGMLSYAKVLAAVSFVAQEQGRGGAKKSAAARLMCSALKQLARYSFNLRLITADERMRIDDVEPPTLSGRTRGRRLSNAETANLYRACARDKSDMGKRDAAVLAIALGGAARRFEISALDLSDYKRPSRVGRDPVEITVRHGKGDQHDTITAPPDVAEAIEAWLIVRGRDAGPLFSSSPGRGRKLVAGSRLSAAGVYALILRRGRQAKLVPEIAPHDLRRTAITVFLERTGDLALAKTYARHADPKTTSQYDLREHEALRKAVAAARTGYVAE